MNQKTCLHANTDTHIQGRIEKKNNIGSRLNYRMPSVNLFRAKFVM